MSKPVRPRLNFDDDIYTLLERMAEESCMSVGEFMSYALTEYCYMVNGVDILDVNPDPLKTHNELRDEYNLILPEIIPEESNAAIRPIIEGITIEEFNLFTFKKWVDNF